MRREDRPSPRLRRLARLLLWSTPVLAGAALGALGLGWLALRSAPGNDWLLARLLPRLQPVAGRLEVGRLRCDLWRELRLEEVALYGPDGELLLQVGEARAELDLLALPALRVRQLELHGLQADLPEPGVFGRMWPGDGAGAPWSGLPFDLELQAVQADGHARLGPLALMGAHLEGAALIRGKVVSVEALRLEAWTNAGRAALQGGLVWTPGRTLLRSAVLTVDDDLVLLADGALDGDRLALHLPFVHLDPAALAALLPLRLPLRGPVHGTVELGGSRAAPALDGVLGSAGGAATVAVAVELDRKAWRLALATASLHTAPLLAIEALRLRGSADLAGEGWSWPEGLRATGTADLVVEVRGEVVAAAGPLRLEAGRLHLDDVVTWLGWAGGRVSGVVDLVARQADVKLVRAQADLDRFGLRGRAGFAGDAHVDFGDAFAVVARGRAKLESFAAGGLRVGRAEGPVDLRWDGQLRGSATLDASAVEVAGQRAQTAWIDADFGEAVAFDLRADGGELLAARGRWSLAERRLDLDRASARLFGLQIEAQGPQALRLTDRGLADTHLDLVVDGARLVARGGFGGEEPLQVELDALDLARLGAVDPRLAGWVGRASGAVSLSGSRAAPRFDGWIEATGLSLGPLHGADRVRLAARSVGEGTEVELRVEEGGQALLTALGRLPLRVDGGARLDERGPVDLVVELPEAATALHAALLDRELPEATVAARLHLGGSLADPEAELEARGAWPGEKEPHARVVAGLDGGRLVVDGQVDIDGRPRAEIHAETAPGNEALRAWIEGGPAPREAPLRAELALLQLPLGALKNLGLVPDLVNGRVAGEVQLSGSLADPQLRGELVLAGGAVGELALDDARIALSPAEGGYEVATRVVFSSIRASARRRRLLGREILERPGCAGATGEPAGSVAVEGFVPLGPELDLGRDGLALRLSGAGFPLAAAEAFSTRFVETSGCLVLGGEVRGSLRAPELALTLETRGAETALPDLGLSLHEVELKGRFEGERLVVDRFALATSTGAVDLVPSRVEATGSVDLQGGELGRIDAALRLDRAWLIARAETRARLSGDLQLAYDDDALDLRGGVRLDDGYLRLGERFFAGARSTRLDPDIEIIRSGGVAAAPELLPGGPGFVFRPMVDVDLDRHARIDLAMPMQGGYGDLARSLTTLSVRSDVDGELQLSHKSGELRVSGEVTTEKGRADVLGRPFEIQEGTIAFTGADYTAPILDLSATHHSTYGDIAVAIGGIPRAPTLEFSSDDIGDDDILAVLVLGAPLSEVATREGGDSGASAALGLVTTMIRNQVSADVASTFRLETLEVDDDSGAVGFSLGRNLTLTTAYHWNLSDPMRDNAFELRMELALPHRWFLEISTGDKGVSTGAAYRKWRF